jgi:hypothetical protein
MAEGRLCDALAEGRLPDALSDRRLSSALPWHHGRHTGTGLIEAKLHRRRLVVLELF